MARWGKYIEATNEGYTTISIGVYVDELFSKMGGQLRIKYKDSNKGDKT